MKYRKLVFGMFLIIGFFVSVTTTVSYANAQETTLIESERQNKFDNGFYDKIQQKINIKNTLSTCFDEITDMSLTTSLILTNQNLSQQCQNNIPHDQQTLYELIDNVDYHNVIFLITPDSDNTNTKGSISEQNKNTLVNNLQDIHGARNIFKAKTLSFVSADVPIIEILKLADYNHIILVGDGQINLNFNLDVSKAYVNSKAQDISPYTGKDVVVGLIDSGIKQDHPDLFPSGSTVVIDQIRCTSSSCTADGNYGDSGSGFRNHNGHGTPNAGIIVGRGAINSDLKGVAPEAKLVNIKISDLDETSFPKALDWLVTNHPEAKAVNVSLGDCENSGQNTILGHIADQAVNLGNDLVYVGSSGNNDGTCPVDSPLVSPPATGYNVISVGNWFYNNGNPIIADHSQHGPLLDGRIKPELVAPGSGIYTSSNNIISNYNHFTGTSHAAPFVTGAVAILKEANPNFTPLETKSALLAGANWGIPLEYTANDYDDCVDTNMFWTCNFDVNKRGFGLLDVAKSLEITNNQNIIKDTITEDDNITNEYALSVTRGIPIKVILTWFHIPNGNDLINPTTGTLGDLTLEILDQDNNVIKTSNSDTQNIEFTIFVPDVTSNNWKIRVSSENNFNPPGTVIEYAISHTQFDFSIPSWIKEHAKEWSANNLSDEQYASNIEFLSNAGIINIDATRTGNNPNIPPFVKYNAGWWSQGLITDREHADALQYLVEKGIITLGISVKSSTVQSFLALTEQTDTYSSGDVTITPVSNPSRGCEPNCYSPSIVTVDAGSTVTFSNTDDLPHSFTSGTPYTGPDGSWNSGIVFGGNDYSVTLHNPGTYNYYSLFDSWMQGTIIVNEPTTPPTSNGATISALRNIPVSITLSASSESTETLDFLITQNPTGGTLSHTSTVTNDTPTSATVTYTSFSSFSGTDSFSFQSRDESGELSGIATITIDVSIPDAQRPTANSQEISVIENFNVPVILTSFDPEGKPLTFSIISNPTLGTLSEITSINDDTVSVIYTPLIQGFTDTDNFQFRVTNGFSTSNAANVDITINSHQNTVPTASPDISYIPEDISSYSIDVLSNDYDADVEFYEDELFVHSINTDMISGGIASISEDSKSISFTPDQNFDGITTLSYITRDSVGEQSNSVNIAINMVPSFDSPTSNPDTTTVGVDSDGNTISVLSNDSDPDTGDVLSVLSIDSTATRGIAQISSDELSILFTPESGFAGTTTLSYVTEDLAGNTDDSTITINVSPSEGKAMYVASGGSGEIIAYNPDGSLLSEHITDELSSPWGVAIPPNGNYIYVSSYTTNKILQYDRATGNHVASFTNNAVSAGTSIAVFAYDITQNKNLLASLQPQNEILLANSNIPSHILNSDITSVLVYDDITGDYIGEFNKIESLPEGFYVDEYTNSVTITDLDGITHEFVNASFLGLSSPRSMTFGPDGNLYISSSGHQNVIKFDVTTNQFEDFTTGVNSQSGGSAQAGLSGPIGIAFGPDGNLYVASAGNNKIASFNGVTGETINEEFVPSNSNELDRPQGITWGPDGNLYVVSLRDNNISVYDSTANLLRIIGEFSDGLDIPHGVTFGPDGNLYVSSFSFSNKILQYDTSGNLINGAFVGSSNNGGLFDPFDLTFADEPVYNVSPVANDDIITQQATQGISFTINTDTLLNNDSDVDDGDTITVQSVDDTSENGGIITYSDNIITYTSTDSFTGDDTFSYTITDGTATDSAVVTVTVIEQPTTPDGVFVYVIDNYSKEMTKFDGMGNYVSTITGFIGPFDVDSDESGNIYASATNWHRIEKYDSNDDLTLTIQGVGKLSVLEQNGFTTIYAPHGTAVDNTTGDIYSVTWAGFVQKWDSEGNYITHWGEKGSNDGQFSSPNGIATDSDGMVYVADRLNHRIQKFDGMGNHLLTFGEQGRNNGQFDWPSKVSVDSTNNVYVADSYNSRIQKFDTSGNHLLTIKMPADDPLHWVADIDTDSEGNIYAIDQRHYRIIKWDSAGTFVDSWAYGSFDKMVGIAVIG